METRTPKPVQVSARLTVDFGTERNVVFEEAWSELNRNFWNPEFNGKNWPKLREEWAPYAAGARTPDELRRDINLLIGELNSSHSGIGPPRSLTPERGVQVGKLGLRFDREKYEGGDGLIVSEVVPLSPAAIEGTIKPGDKLVAVNGEAIGSKDLDELLEDTVGERVALGVETAGKARVAIVRPVAQGAVAGELYRRQNWLRAHGGYERRVAAAALYRPGRAERVEAGRGHRRAQQQRRVHQRVCAGCADAQELPGDDSARYGHDAEPAEPGPARAGAADRAGDERKFVVRR
jgi:hypothetical protein